MMESALIFLTSLITLRTNLGLSEQVQPSRAGLASLGTSLEDCGAISSLVSVGFQIQVFADPDPGGLTDADPDPGRTLSSKKLDFDIKNIGTLCR
jgi:hypothetical protein